MLSQIDCRLLISSGVQACTVDLVEWRKDWKVILNLVLGFVPMGMLVKCWIK